jgi:hypothetical protein
MIFLTMRADDDDRLAGRVIQLTRDSKRDEAKVQRIALELFDELRRRRPPKVVASDPYTGAVTLADD